MRSKFYLLVNDTEKCRGQLTATAVWGHDSSGNISINTLNGQWLYLISWRYLFLVSNFILFCVFTVIHGTLRNEASAVTTPQNTAVVWPDVSPEWLKREWVCPVEEALATAEMVRDADQPWLLRPPLTVSPLLVSMTSWCCTFWVLWPGAAGAVRLWAGLLRPRPVVAETGADGPWIACSRVGLFRKESKLGLLRPEGEAAQRAGITVYFAATQPNQHTQQSQLAQWHPKESQKSIT